MISTAPRITVAFADIRTSKNVRQKMQATSTRPQNHQPIEMPTSRSRKPLMNHPPSVSSEPGRKMPNAT